MTSAELCAGCWCWCWFFKNVFYRGSTVTAKRTQSRLTKTNEQTPATKPKLRLWGGGGYHFTSADICTFWLLKASSSLIRVCLLCCLRSVVSAGDLHCSVAGSAAHITVTTAQGQVWCWMQDFAKAIGLIFSKRDVRVGYGPRENSEGEKNLAYFENWYLWVCAVWCSLIEFKGIPLRAILVIEFNSCGLDRTM